MILTDEQALQLLKDNQTEAPKWVRDARNYSKDACALLDGENFSDLLIDRIEKIENSERALARKKYARDITDCVSRISKPIQNVFSSTGGVKNYKNGDTQLSDVDQKRLLSLISNIRDGKSIERYIESKWMPLYHSDPSGVQWLVYTSTSTGVVDKIYPTYQSIKNIRNYLPKGQLVEWIIFEPVTIKSEKFWTIVDDSMQRYYKQDSSQAFTLVDDPTKTFAHPFGTVPIIINSDLTDKTGARVSPFEDAIPLLKEYARDLSIKTIYKFLQGFPKHWRRIMFCAACRGSKKNGEGKDCEICSGTGTMGKQDVTDDTLLPAEVFAEDQKLSGNDIMGYASPDLETWGQMNEELEMLESLAFETIWGCPPMKKKSATKEGDGPKTATEIMYNMQPQINKLNKYADACEWMEWTITEWIANAIDAAKAKDASISLIVYGRRYIMEGVDTLQQKYESAKAAGDTVGILDAIYQELLTVKFKNDPEWMRIELIKSRVEPYLHSSADEIFNRYGWKESAKKDYFQQWWSDLSDSDLKGIDIEKKLEAKFASDFKIYLATIEYVPPSGAPAIEEEPANNS